MRLGLYLTSMIQASPVRDLVELGRLAEDLGFDDLCMGEHVVAADATPAWAPRAPHPPTETFPEPLTTFAALAVATSRVRLVTCILIAPLRPAALLAKTAATLHALSNGRLVLGVSVSWMEPEYAALGIPFEERGVYLDDVVGACRALWSTSPASFSGTTVQFTDMYCEPRPAHPDDITIWFGGICTPRLVRRVAHFGQGFLPHLNPRDTWEQVATETARIKDAMRVVGRDPSTLEVGVRFPPYGRPFEEQLASDMEQMRDAGVTQLYCPLRAPHTVAEAAPLLEKMVRAFEPYRHVAVSG
ncbi:MAG: TIGR03619 family F420-dependent LLM class oxidoreductase [Chloroflexi bacterium]|nr:TIGR03619 family F420-dependent LLM class oxidoreductase [Chloroflexota bacterium]